MALCVFAARKESPPCRPPEAATRIGLSSVATASVPTVRTDASQVQPSLLLAFIEAAGGKAHPRRRTRRPRRDILAIAGRGAGLHQMICPTENAAGNTGAIRPRHFGTTPRTCRLFLRSRVNAGERGVVRGKLGKDRMNACSGIEPSRISKPVATELEILSPPRCRDVRIARCQGAMVAGPSRFHAGFLKSVIAVAKAARATFFLLPVMIFTILLPRSVRHGINSGDVRK
jgi:hypothetical protein